MDKLSSRIEDLILKYESMSPDDFVDYFESKVVKKTKAVVFVNNTVTFEDIETARAFFQGLQLLPPNLDSSYAANDDICEYSLCA